MLAKADLNKKLDKKEYGAAMKDLEPRLRSLQMQMKELGIPLLVVFEGWGASGKSTHIGKLVNPLDPRDFTVHTMDKMNEDKLFRPFLWQYQRFAPAKGQIAIYDKSWHRIGLPEGVDRWQLTETERAGFYDDINAFERQLLDDGTVIVKFFLHIGKDEQRKRFMALEVNEATRWRIDDEDRKQNAEYGRYLKLFEHMLAQNRQGAEWTVIEAEDRKYAAVKMFTTIIGALEKAIAGRGAGPSEKAVKLKKAPAGAQGLAGVDLARTISDIEYKEKLKYYQSKISALGYALYAKRIPAVIVYEGWDAAGKGGNIKRLTQELDPRGYEVIPVPAPTREELARHYLWRFWRNMPKDGHIAIFDRSWYGRVLVERAEGLATEAQWKRAYDEINQMERHMHNHGVVIFKFWLHIDKDEQLARFTSRENEPLKQYKITDEDWRNREKWDVYEACVNDMLARTDTEFAPWTVVESNDKRFARIKTLEIVCNRLEQRASQRPEAAKVYGRAKP